VLWIPPGTTGAAGHRLGHVPTDRDQYAIAGRRPFCPKSGQNSRVLSRSASCLPLADSCTATNDVHGLHWLTELRRVLRQVAGLGAFDAGLSKSQIFAMQP
jgi:hypothetical protein